MISPAAAAAAGKHHRNSYLSLQFEFTLLIRLLFKFQKHYQQNSEARKKSGFSSYQMAQI